MDAVLVSTAFGLGLLFVFEGLARPRAATEVLGRIGAIGPRAIAAAAGAAVGLMATGWPVTSFACGAAAWAVPGSLRRSRAERARVERREAIADVSSRLRDLIRSGVGISDALAESVEHAPRAIAADLRRLVAESRVSGLVKASSAFARRLSDPSAELLASALATAERMGSRNLSDVLDALAESTTGHAAAIREARVRQTRNRMSARIVAAAPVFLLLAIRRANPAYLEAYGAPAGQAVLALALVLIWGGYVAMRQAARIEGDGR